MTEEPIRHERDLVKIAPKNPEVYKEISLAALTVYSLYWLHQWSLRRTIEAVAVINWRLFPHKFGMVGFEQYPDAFRTNRSLLQGQPKYRNWLTGAASKGFSLNERGLTLAHNLIETLGVPELSDGSLSEKPSPIVEGKGLNKKPARTIEPEREVKRAKESQLFQKWLSGIMSDRDLIHVHALLSIFDHTPRPAREKKMKDLERHARDVNDDELLRFLSDVRQNFPIVFQRER